MVAVAGFGSLWAVVSFVQAGLNGARFASKVVTKPAEAIDEVLAAQPTRRELKEVKRGVSDLEIEVSRQSEMLGAVIAQLELMQAQSVAAGAMPLGADQRVRRR